MKKKRILFVTYGDDWHASSRIRAVNYFSYLENWNFQCYHYPIRKHPQSVRKILGNAISKRTYSLFIFIHIALWRPDFIFSQRIILPQWLVNWVKLQKVQLIFDFDDAIHLERGNSLKKTQRMCRSSDLNIVSTPYLSKFLSQFSIDSVVIHSSVEKKPARKSKNSENIYIGWLGSPSTAGYLMKIKHVIDELLNKYDQLRFISMGAGQDVINHPRSTNYPWDIREQDQFLHRLDIGIMPLPNDQWTEYKGGYKLIEYINSDAAVVGSGVGINSEIIIDGVSGYIAQNEHDWKRKLEDLILDKARREQFVSFARKKILPSFLYETNAVLLKNCLENLKK